MYIMPKPLMTLYLGCVAGQTTDRTTTDVQYAKASNDMARAAGFNQ